MNPVESAILWKILMHNINFLMETLIKKNFSFDWHFVANLVKTLQGYWKNISQIKIFFLLMSLIFLFKTLVTKSEEKCITSHYDKMLFLSIYNAVLFLIVYNVILPVTKLCNMQLNLRNL